MNTTTLPHYQIKRLSIAALTVFLMTSNATIIRAQDQGASPSPPTDYSTPPQGKGGKSGKGSKGGPGGGLHLLPPRMADQLNLSDDQKNQIAALETEMKTRLEKILLPDQMEKLKQDRPGHSGGKRGKHGEGADAAQLPPAPPSTSPATQATP